MLKRLQALGDLESLRQRNRRVLHLHMRGDVAGGVKKLAKAVG